MANSDYAYFAAIPWCAKHMQGDRIITQPEFARAYAVRRKNKYSFFAETLQSERAVARMLLIYEEPALPHELVNQIKILFTLGEGLNGHPKICHGGMVMAILDEAIGSITPINRKRNALSERVSMTAYLNTNFIKPVPTSSTLLVRAWCAKREGRKFFAEGEIEDENGVILARAKGLFIEMKSAL
ncbi:thioesterase superfamily protein [Xylaria nigripes]|nr:thioesterase superfamily protein [Xylaria nigripes]